MEEREFLQYEDAIVWLEDPARFKYVRQLQALSRSRSRNPGRGCYNGRLVGYSTLSRHAPETSMVGRARWFHRRVFYVTGWDPYQDGRMPMEAVDPRTIQPGVWGKAPASALAPEAV